MALRDDFERLHGTILHHTSPPSVDSIVNELLIEEIRLKSHSHSHHERGNLLPSPSVFVAPFNKEKLQGRVGIDECSFSRKRGIGKHNVQNH